VCVCVCVCVAPQSMNERLHSGGRDRLHNSYVILPPCGILGPVSLAVLMEVKSCDGQQCHYTIGMLCRTSKVSGVGIYWRLASCVTRSVTCKRGGVEPEFVDLVYLSSVFIMLL
jgi:hypothetical protein